MKHDLSGHTRMMDRIRSAMLASSVSIQVSEDARSATVTIGPLLEGDSPETIRVSRPSDVSLVSIIAQVLEDRGQGQPVGVTPPPVAARSWIVCPMCHFAGGHRDLLDNWLDCPMCDATGVVRLRPDGE